MDGGRDEGMKDGGKFQRNVGVAWLVCSAKAECRDWRRAFAASTAQRCEWSQKF